LVTIIITTAIISLLILPVYILWDINVLSSPSPSVPVTMGVLLVFTLVFSAVLSFFTKAKRLEILGAAAA
jgi:hypothetical protein